MYSLTKAIAESFPSHYHPFTILNKLTRQYVDPAEDLLAGTFLLESATRVYIDYHRFIAMAKEAIRPPSRGLFIEFVFHKNSQTVQLGYGFEPSRSSIVSKPFQSTITELISRSGPSVIIGNNSFGYFLHRNGFQHVIPFEQQRQLNIVYHYTTHIRFNNLSFYSYHTFKRTRIAMLIQQFIQTNNIKSILFIFNPESV